MGKMGRKLKECYDHLGNRYESLDAMCNTYGINAGTFRSRIMAGKNLEKALTDSIESKCKICRDHLGNEYNSMEDMCKAYGIRVKTFYQRLSRGKTIEEALTSELREVETSGKPCTDHLGNKYKSIKNMCDTYGIQRETFLYRLSQGKTLEEALTSELRTSSGRRIHCKDHLGNLYTSIEEMCRAYGINGSLFNRRIKHGATLEEALTGMSKTITDYLGNTYKSFRCMCNSYGLTATTVSSRIQHGVPLEDALTLPVLKDCRIRRSHIGEDGKQYYKIIVQDKVYSLNAKQILEYVDKGIFKRKNEE